MKRELKTHRINLKLSDTDYALMVSLMDTYGYRSLSLFWRDLLNGKRLNSRRRVDRLTEQALLGAMDRMTAQVAAVGRNYNQVVARIETLSSMHRPNGAPVINDGLVAREMDRLQKMTEKLRDEVAVCIEIVDRYTKSEDNGPHGPQTQ